jgi:hypothetical protein
MKAVFIVITSLLLSSNAHAQVNGQPFRLEPGVYDSECWFVNVIKTENGDYRRNDGYEKGTFTSIIDGDVAMEIVQAKGLGRTTTHTVTKVITTPLENGVFKQTSEIESTDSLGHFSSTARMRYETNMKVIKNHIQNIMVRYGDEGERPAFGESLWHKLKDGRVFVQSYLREKTPIATLVGGQQKYQEKVVANMVCAYTPQKN